jgi:hypothetical protein
MAEDFEKHSNKQSEQLSRVIDENTQLRGELR